MNWVNLHYWLTKRWNKLHNCLNNNIFHNIKCWKRHKPSMLSNANDVLCLFGFMRFNSLNLPYNYSHWIQKLFLKRISSFPIMLNPMSSIDTICPECKNNTPRSSYLWMKEIQWLRSVITSIISRLKRQVRSRKKEGKLFCLMYRHWNKNLKKSMRIIY